MECKKEDQGWIEVSLLVEGELAEPVADVLAEHLSDGVVLEQATDFAEEGGERGFRVRVYGYIPVDPRLEGRKTAIKRALWHLSQIEELPSPKFKPLKVEDWRTAWQKHYRPITLGKRIIIVPSWMPSPDDEREAIFIDPGMAFGSGTHPSTQLSLVMIDEVIEEMDEVPEGMIDLGCGSGILSIAAVKLGVPFVLALDRDPEAVRVARSNLLKNEIQERVKVGHGSVSELRDGMFDLQRAPLVCANIVAPILRQLFEEGLASIVSPGGVLILSGILEGQVPDMLDLLAEHRFRMVSRKREKNWVAIESQKVAV